MKHKILIAILLVILTGAMVLSGSDPDSNDNALVLMDNSVFEHPCRPGARFDHDLHNEQAGLDENCALCHHVYEDGQLIESESSEDSLCSDCHGLKKSPDNTVALRTAFHKRCKNCHFTQKKGPVLCGECHTNKGGVL